MSSRSRDRSSIAPFDPNVFLAETGSGKNLERFQKKQKIYVQGDPADTVCYLRKGRVKATVLSDHGREAIVGIHQTGQFFGEASLAARLRTTTTVALEECLITFITKEAML